MTGLFQKIEELDSSTPNMVLTALDPEFFGEKALFSGQTCIWESRKNGFFTEHRKEIPDLEKDGICVVSGKQVFCEFLSQEKHLVICGGGHVSIPVIKIGRMVGFKVTVLEDRPKFADHARGAGADQVICGPFEQSLAALPGNKDTFFVVVTRGHRYDEMCLKQITSKEYAYIGMMGSRLRAAKVKEALAQSRVSPAIIGDIHSPIGLKIGAETPEEIGVSIMAEVIQIKNQSCKNSGFTKEIVQAVLKEPGQKVLATIVSRKGSAPRDVGTKMLILRDGRTVGTIGGGCLEAEVFQKSLQLLLNPEKTSLLCHADMSGNDAEEEGMVCGGSIDVLLEAYV